MPSPLESYDPLKKNTLKMKDLINKTPYALTKINPFSFFKKILIYIL